MTKQKDLKRVVRARMQKTGEAYTTARLQTIREKPKKAVTPAAPEYATLAGMSDDAVKAKTGRDWGEWVRELDAIGAATMSHRDIARRVHDEFGAGDWWGQTVTVGYERIRGLRAIGQRRAGAWEAAKSRTYPVPLAALYAAWADAKKRARWLPDAKLSVRKATAERSMRITWGDGTSVELWFTSKGDAKSSVQVQHTKLATKEDATRLKAYWGERLDALGDLLARANE
ncbi:MAG: hypothetical protein NDJ92_11010 [Thermoanaerobaculia bacterium]|nr:hypothetical protein [Thermoanaerobaculia bacterium]